MYSVLKSPQILRFVDDFVLNSIEARYLAVHVFRNSIEYLPFMTIQPYFPRILLFDESVPFNAFEEQSLFLFEIITKYLCQADIITVPAFNKS